tara:strand:- start:9074 stop:10051 length:978 start_codon:yes stop_codon:yes gene_type:complete
MEPNVLILVSLIFIILIGSACCSGAEAAFLAVNSIRIIELAAKQKTKGSANQLLKLRKHLGRTLTVITITNNGFNIIGSLILGFYGALVINNRLGLTIFTIGFYVLVVLIGEVLPKAIGTRFSLQISILSVPILRTLNILMRPFLTLIEKLFPVITAENEISTDEAEIRQMAKIGSQKGLIEADEAAMISKVFQLNDLKAKDLMIPRVSAPSLNGRDTLENIVDLIISNNSPWWVVLGDKVDKIQGVANREKLLTALINKNYSSLISDLCDPVDYIPEMIKIDKLLTTFDNDNKGVKVVVDEFGGFVGLIGAEAILSVLAGWWKE